MISGADPRSRRAPATGSCAPSSGAQAGKAAAATIATAIARNVFMSIGPPADLNDRRRRQFLASEVAVTICRQILDGKSELVWEAVRRSGPHPRDENPLYAGVR